MSTMDILGLGFVTIMGIIVMYWFLWGVGNTVLRGEGSSFKKLVVGILVTATGLTVIYIIGSVVNLLLL